MKNFLGLLKTTALKDKKVLLLCGLVFYALLATKIDYFIFYLLNGHLQFMPKLYLYFWALLNDPYENTFNLFFISGAIIILIYRKSLRVHATALYFVVLGLWYEIGFQVVRILENWSLLARSSPSLEHDLLFNLSSIHAAAKVFAPTSFPSGHALIYGFFYATARDLLKDSPQERAAKGKIFIFTLLACLPRLIGGAHSFSDILVGYMIGILWYRLLYLCISGYDKASIFLSRVNFVKEDFLARKDDTV